MVTIYKPKMSAGSSWMGSHSLRFGGNPFFLASTTSVVFTCGNFLWLVVFRYKWVSVLFLVLVFKQNRDREFGKVSIRHKDKNAKNYFNYKIIN